MLHLRRKLSLVALGLALFGCSSAPVQPELSPQERLKLDRGAGTQLSARFDRFAVLSRDVEVSGFLRRIAERLLEAAPDLRGTPVGVIPIQDRSRRWRSFGFPGNRIYLSSGLLRAVEFENEAAALIAYELAHIRRRSLLVGIESRRRENQYGENDFFGEAGVFAFPLDERLHAVSAAVGLMYAAGYDPRGLNAIWKRFQATPDQSPFDGSTLDRLIETTRLEIAQYSPLRNPIVRSEEFIKVRARLKKL